ncbi:precorrin-2 C(20)-methyltransferase [Ancylobacter terrae]|uniref:precorrin-2 C(20)-methyltransferase n=1 Tax=Ancylobacter sp. sgz301288 TaxID=3342077 RepID=UPI00385B9642
MSAVPRSGPGRLIGVGVGPGDPELMTLKAVRALGRADVVAYFAKRGNASHARAIAATHFPPGIAELELGYPVTTEMPHTSCGYRAAIDGFYDASAEAVAAHLEQGRTVAVLSEGDPLFYGSYMHLHVRLSPRFPAEVIAGVTGMSGCWSLAGAPIAQGDDVLAVLPGTLGEADLAARLKGADAAVIMKVGRNLPKIRRALAAAGRLERAVYVERGTMEGARCEPLAGRGEEPAPYFAIVLVPGWSARG